MKSIDERNLFSSKSEAIHAIYAKLDHDLCKNCTARIFKECGTTSQEQNAA
jgi:SulP family sulfate permease